MEREMKKQTAEYKDIKGLLTDVNINNNVGNPTFDNLTLTPIGKLTKRKGFKNIINYDEKNADLSNLKVNYGKVWANSNLFYVHTIPVYTSGTEVKHKDIIYSAIKNNKNYIIKSRLDENDNVLSTKMISYNNLQVKAGRPAKVIPTPEMAFIVSNEITSEETSSGIFKHMFKRVITNGDADIMQNVVIDSDVWVNGSVLENVSSVSEIGTFRYKVVPVYNTGAEGSIKSDNDIYNYTAVITKVTQGVVLRVYSTRDPFIIGYKVYRSKVNTQTVNVIRTDVSWGALVQNTVTEVKPAKEGKREYYFLAYFPKPATAQPSIPVSLIAGYWGSTAYTERDIKSTNLGDLYSRKEPINRVATENNGLIIDGENWTTGAYEQRDIPALSKVLGFFGMRGTCACYAQKRGFMGGDKRYPHIGFVSELDKIDSYGSLIYTFELANDTNEQTSIEEVGNNIYWFLQHSLYVLRPTSDTDIPYTKELISPTVGCDSLNSCVLDNICYFIFNEKLWALNEFGQYKEISAAVNTQLTGKATGSEIVLRANASERFIKIMYRTSLGEAVNIDYYPVLDLYRKHVGKKDIYGISGSTAVLESGNEHYQLINYQHVPDLGESWGVDIDGNIVKETTDYQDTSLGNQKVTWNDYTADSTAAIRTYSVDGIMEKPFVFNSRVRFNSVVLFGSGDIDFAYKVDNGSYSDYKTVTMTRTGVEIPINGVGTIHSIKLRHTANSDIDYDYMRVKWTAQTSVDISNNVDTGS